jgi:hypothetical protein
VREKVGVREGFAGRVRRCVLAGCTKAARGDPKPKRLHEIRKESVHEKTLDRRDRFGDFGVRATTGIWPGGLWIHWGFNPGSGWGSGAQRQGNSNEHGD